MPLPASRTFQAPPPTAWSLSGPDIRAALSAALSAALATCFQSGHKVLACGHGGSACDAIHFAEEFTGRFRKPGDLLLAISTSGNSANVIRAVETAKGLGMGVILLLGKSGGKLKGTGTYEILVASGTTERVQEIHMPACMC